VILIAPTAFKGTIGAAEAAAAMAEGARLGAPGVDVRTLPLSDGGPGLIDALGERGAHLTRVRVAGPLGTPVDARILRLGTLAVVESADACGLHLVPAGARDPLRTDTRGVGQLLLAAAALPEVRELACGLGGSATVDGGAGVARALGYELLAGDGAPLSAGGGALVGLARIRPPARTPVLPPVAALVDVESPLLGPEGAAAVFGPQKGADAAGVALLETGLSRLAERIQLDLGLDVSTLPGAGAAGGLGAGLVAFVRARLVPGSAWVLDAVHFDAALARARLVVTGEGSYDEQSALGKITGTVVRRARTAGVPVVLLCGHIRSPLPPGVMGVDGAGHTLGVADLAALARDACARALAG
jgi:glycerate kinase